jgi:hypothetical protein
LPLPDRTPLPQNDINGSQWQDITIEMDEKERRRIMAEPVIGSWL